MLALVTLYVMALQMCESARQLSEPLTLLILIAKFLNKTLTQKKKKIPTIQTTFCFSVIVQSSVRQWAQIYIFQV